MPTLQSVMALACFVLGFQQQDPEALIAHARTAYKSGDFGQSTRLYEEALKAGSDPLLPTYNAACCYALLGRGDDAFAWLDKALAAGWRDVERLESDADFHSLHGDPRWDPMVARCRESLAKFRESVHEPRLREELLKRMQEDQRLRTSPSAQFWEIWEVDLDNTAFMKTVIDKHGWPGTRMVGQDGATAAWLLVQHADADRAFQRRCLDLLTRAAEQKEALPEHMAYLTDRVLVGEGKPQRFGTQFATVGGELKPFPIEDETNVDTRRKAVGLPPLAEYARRMRELQQP